MGYLRAIRKALIPPKYAHKLRPIFFGLRGTVYAGNKVQCPCCDGRFRKFLPATFDRRPNALCPRCGSLERHRLLWLYLKDKTDFFRDRLRVLHFAPEYVFQRSSRSLPNLDYVRADLLSPLADARVDIAAIPFEVESFDVILCNHVLAYVRDEQKALTELLRVLKPGGWAIFQDPIKLHLDKTQEHSDAGLVRAGYRPEGYARTYGRDYPDRLRQAGFVVQVDRHARGLGPELVRKYGLKEDEDIFFCRRRTQNNA